MQVENQALLEFRAGIGRDQRAIQLSRQEAQQTLRNELKSTLTALLLSCEMALKVHLASGAETRMRAV